MVIIWVRKIKIPYDSTMDVEITQTCLHGHGINYSTVKLFTACSCGCGVNGINVVGIKQ